MNDVDRIIDSALRSDRTVEPSPFLVKRVMASLQGEERFPPIPFPARRVAAAFLLLVVMIVSMA